MEVTMMQAFDTTVAEYHRAAAQADMPGEDKTEAEVLEAAVKALGVWLQMNGQLSKDTAFRVYGLELPGLGEWEMERRGL